MDQFNENLTTNTEIKVVKGTILGPDNEASGEYDLFYWANFIPHFENKTVKIIGECGFNDVLYERKDFIFNYDTETDTVKVDQPYRITTCSDELYNRYEKNIYYNDNKTVEGARLPWIRFFRTKDGVMIPELIEKIMGRIPNKIVFY
jgi:hypothetical protein